MEVKICPACNKTFSVTKRNKNKIYCCKKCADEGLKIIHYDMTNPPVCKNCGATLSHARANKGNKFCNNDCFLEYRKKQKEIKENSIPTKYCCICNKELSRQQVKDNRICCSAKCAYLYRVNKYGCESKRNPGKFEQSSTAQEKRKSEEYITNMSKLMQDNWKNTSFRNKVITRMKENNPVHDRNIINKINETKKKNGTLHTWKGERGGNGTISSAEAILKEQLIPLGFEYNKAINTRFMREKFPERRYASNYKPDFLNPYIRLCVEVDGKAHNTTNVQMRDKKKEECLQGLGYTVIRFTNIQVINNTNEVVQTIKSVMEGMS